MAESSVALAIVVDNRDDSGTGRVRVSYPWHDQPLETYWARVAVPMAGKRRGFYFIPEPGDEVLVAFERGDLRLPYVVGSLWNLESPTPATNADGRNDLRQIRTRKGHTLTFNDGAKANAELRLNDGKRLTIDDNAITLQDQQGNGFTIDSRTGSIRIQAAGSLTLKAASISIESSGAIDVKGSGTLTLRGALVNIN
jgi:uncharacterized protein involved in type VI secretion and phage assembly